MYLGNRKSLWDGHNTWTVLNRGNIFFIQTTIYKFLLLNSFLHHNFKAKVSKKHPNLPITSKKSRASKEPKGRAVCQHDQHFTPAYKNPPQPPAPSYPFWCKKCIPTFWYFHYFAVFASVQRSQTIKLKLAPIGMNRKRIHHHNIWL